MPLSDGNPKAKPDSARGAWFGTGVRSFRGRIARSGTFLRFTSSAVTLSAVTMLCHIIVLRWLPPEAVGTWQSLLLIGTYAGIASAGATHGLNRELPFLFGTGDSRAVEDLAGTARSIALVGGGLCLTAIPVGWLVFEGASERWGAAAVLVGAAAELYRRYLGATYRAGQAFETLARLQAVQTVLTVVTLPLVLWQGYAGLAIQFVFLRSTSAILGHAYRPLRRVGPFRMASLKKLMTSGIPLFLFGYLSDVARSFPRLALLSLGGVGWVGLFAPANAIIGAIGLIPGSVGTYVYPKMSFTYGKTGRASSIWPMARTTALGALVVGIPVALVMAVVAETLLPRFFPAYSAAVPAVQWTAIGGVFIGASVAVNALASLKAYKWMITFLVSRGALLFALPWLGGKLTGDITGVAAGMTVAYAVDFVVVVFVVYQATKGTRDAEG
ncbi:MAG TPA: hypothetical protein PLL76_22955 [Thermoanaerobaculia bacterium]|nr:hypothetical protein [Thermoanaerobaculia bacterium]